MQTAQRHQHLSPTLQVDCRRRLALIEGQVRGLQKMIEQDRYCPDILTQIEASREALRQVGKVVFRNYLVHCVADAVKDGDTGIFDELIDTVNKLNR